jgi:hypothetical protein
MRNAEMRVSGSIVAVAPAGVLLEDDRLDDFGPRIRHLTKPAQFDKKRYQLEWVLRLEPGLSRHVTLFNLECFPPHALAAGEGGDEPEALLDLWTTLTDRKDPAEAIEFVAEAYHRRTGRQPE